MKNFRQPGKIITVVATAAVVSGRMYQVGGLIGVATGSAAIGEEYELALLGVYRFAKDSGLVLAQGDAVDWENSSSSVVADAAGDFDAGIVSKAAGAGETEVEVLLPLGGY